MIENGVAFDSHDILASSECRVSGLRHIQALNRNVRGKNCKATVCKGNHIKVNANIMTNGGMMRKLSRIIVALILFGMIAISCATALRHPGLQNAHLPDLIPLREFFVNIHGNFGYRVPPDGKKIAWIAVKNRRLTIYSRWIGPA